MSKRVRCAPALELPDVMLMCVLHFVDYMDHVVCKQVCRLWRTVTAKAQKTHTVLYLQERGKSNVGFAIMVEAMAQMMSPLRVRTWIVDAQISHEATLRVLSRFDRFDTVKWQIVRASSSGDGTTTSLFRVLRRCDKSLRVLEIAIRDEIAALRAVGVLYNGIAQHGRSLTELWIDETYFPEVPLCGVAPLSKWTRLSHLTRLRLPPVNILEPVAPLLKECTSIRTLWLDLVDDYFRVPLDDRLPQLLTALASAPLTTLTLRLFRFSSSLSEAAVRSLPPHLLSLTIICRDERHAVWSAEALHVLAHRWLPQLKKFRHKPLLTLPEWFLRQTMDTATSVDMNGVTGEPTDLTLFSQWLRCHPLSTHVFLLDPDVYLSDPARTAWRALADVWSMRYVEFVRSRVLLSSFLGSLFRWGVPGPLVDRAFGVAGKVTVDDAAFAWHPATSAPLPLRRIVLVAKLSKKLTGAFFESAARAMAGKDVLFYMDGLDGPGIPTSAQLTTVSAHCAIPVADASALAKAVLDPPAQCSFACKIGNLYHHGHVWELRKTRFWTMVHSLSKLQNGCLLFT